jgi:hypothetical protein
VDVVTVCPGPTRTEFENVANVDFRRLSASAVLNASDVVAAAVRTLGRRPSIVVGFSNKMKALSPRLIPRRTAADVFGQFVRTTGQNVRAG